MAQSWRPSLRTGVMFFVMVVGGVIAGVCLSAMEAITGGRLRTGHHASRAARVAPLELTRCPICASAHLERLVIARVGFADYCPACGWQGLPKDA